MAFINNKDKLAYFKDNVQTDYQEEFDANKYYYNRDGGSLEQMQHHGDNRNFSGYNMNAGYMHNQGPVMGQQQHTGPRTMPPMSAMSRSQTAPSNGPSMQVLGPEHYMASGPNTRAASYGSMPPQGPSNNMMNTVNSGFYRHDMNNMINPNGSVLNNQQLQLSPNMTQYGIPPPPSRTNSLGGGDAINGMMYDQQSNFAMMQPQLPPPNIGGSVVGPNNNTPLRYSSVAMLGNGMSNATGGMIRNDDEFSIHKEDFPALPGAGANTGVGVGGGMAVGGNKTMSQMGGGSDVETQLLMSQMHNSNNSNSDNLYLGGGGSRGGSSSLPQGQSQGSMGGGPQHHSDNSSSYNSSGALGHTLSTNPQQQQQYNSLAQSMHHSEGIAFLNSSNVHNSSSISSSSSINTANRSSQSNVNASSSLMGGSSGNVSGMGNALGAGSTGSGMSGNVAGAGARSNIKFGLLGLLDIICIVDRDVSALALGSDLTTFGLNLNSSDTLFSNFNSPFTEQTVTSEPNFVSPACYQMHPPSIKPEHLTKFTLETLFYMFYSMPGDVLQMSSAHELYKREWKYQTELKLWLKLRTSLELSQSHPSVLYLFFDPSVFEVRLYSNPNVRAVITQGFLTEDDVRVKSVTGSAVNASGVGGGGPGNNSNAISAQGGNQQPIGSHVNSAL